MSYLVLALKWRPQRFQDVTGQHHVSRTLSNALKTNRTAHAYLFCGPRGVGKTSMARILAKAVNCIEGPNDEPCNHCESCREITTGRAMDVIEIDGASNRGIDDIRDLREGVRYAPAHLQTKVYIIDEVHMLTQDAFNALLKTLEEPPPNVIFVLATTEPLKVPQTILSRCQRFDFARLRTVEAAARLAFICEQESIAAEGAALSLIARKGEGSMRDALTLLDQVIATGLSPLTAAGVTEALGIAGRELYFEWSAALIAHDSARALRSLGEAVEDGANLQELAEEFLLHLRNLLIVATDASLTELVEGTDEEKAQYIAQAAEWNAIDLLRACRLAMEALTAMRRSGVPRVHLELLLAELAELPTGLDLRRFLDATRGRVLEGASGEVARAMAAPATTRGAAPQGLPSRGVAPRAETPHAATEASPELADPAAGIAAVRAQLQRSGSSKPGGDRAVAPPANAGSSAPPKPSTQSTSEPAVSTSSIAAPAASDAAPIEGAEAWDKSVEAISAKKPGLAMFLIGSVLLAREGNALRVGIAGYSAYHREQVEKAENRRLILGSVETHFGPGASIKYEAISEGAGAAARARATTNVAGSSGDLSVGDASGGDRSAGDRTGGDKSSGDNATSPDQVRRIADLFDGDVIGPA